MKPITFLVGILLAIPGILILGSVGLDTISIAILGGINGILSGLISIILCEDTWN